MLGFATSAVRDAVNSDEVLAHVERHSGVTLEVLSGEDEARLTFLAVRRWFGWSAGRLAVFDIGGGSLEIAGGADEAPDVAWSLPLGAARMARTWFGGGRPVEDGDARAAAQIRAEIARDAGHLLRPGVPDRAAATSKTFRSLARICGAAPSGDGPLVPRVLELDDAVGVDPQADGHVGRGARRPARASRPAAPTRSSPARWSPRRAWTSSTCRRWRSARGRCVRA